MFRRLRCRMVAVIRSMLLVWPEIALTTLPCTTDEAFHDLLSTARFFSDLSPRASRAPFSSLPSSYDSGRTTLPPASSSTSAWAASALPLSSAGPRSTSSSDDGAADESDPALASESVPTLESLSSGAEGERSPLLGTGTGTSKRTKEARQDQQRSESHSSERASDPAAHTEKKAKKKGWFSWIRGGTVELKVWHLVGICGVLIGAGWAARYAAVSLLALNGDSRLNSADRTLDCRSSTARSCTRSCPVRGLRHISALRPPPPPPSNRPVATLPRPASLRSHPPRAACPSFSCDPSIFGCTIIRGSAS